ncbi:malate dehydrogenase [candidate division WOR-3 bacterium]|uniref:Malate dehydrogenase n=1 Tax=candidate division WOR-3 bacterium TaxID=2052148 RepID=A0A9D5QDK3_UNCW3|nr:malate dehydrogenase [candidate division WOR-3 bacterium]MBD3364140.1 malate dehydrogenase [candidate division WOR-3 bacterium]
MARVKIEPLRTFTIEVFTKLGMSEENAVITTDVLLASDRRGIASHGVARLKRYVDGIRAGIMKPDAEPEILKETATTLLVDGQAGMGQVVSVKTMRRVIEKARVSGMAAAVIRNSNHYGIAGYCAMTALEHDLIGFSATNSAPLVVPTFGKDAVLGTNPISVAVPAGKERPFVLDMATSTVPRGKLEVYKRLGKRLPPTWATDKDGNPTGNPGQVLKNLLDRAGGGLLPLGGAGEEDRGYKGFDLAAVVEVLSGGLGLASMGREVYGCKGRPPDVSHFLAALDPGAFGDISDFKKRMDSFIRMVKDVPPAEGAERIWIAGEKEAEAEDRNKTEVDIDEPTYDKLIEIGEGLGVEAAFQGSVKS